MEVNAIEENNNSVSVSVAALQHEYDSLCQ